MSVVNRMLQDIDRRRAAAVANTANTTVGTTAGVTAVAGPHPEIRSAARGVSQAKWRGVPSWLILVFVASLVGWFTWWQQRLPSSMEIPKAASAEPAPVVVSSSIISEPALPLSEQKPPEMRVPSDGQTQTRSAPRLPADTLRLSMQLSALVADTPTDTRRRAPSDTTPSNASLAATVAASAPAASVVAASAAAPSAVNSAPAGPALPTVPAAAGKTTITNVPIRQVAFDETINIARSLWSEGNRASALNTLRDALLAAESTRNQRATAALARELARLEVADNRAQTALELLKRLENLLGDDADAWSLRGNAEQRLALHADAVQSYLIALRIRPTEGKWMIGAAISLAAVGKLDEAQSWAERARERDAVTPAIASYLQQLGITSRR